MESFSTAVHSNPHQKLLLGSDAYDIIWDLVYKERGIKLYGVKYIKPVLGGFMYEAVVFDNFPKDKEAYSICIGDTEEESYLKFVSDTCVRFVLSRRLSDGDGFWLAWN